MKCTKMEGCGNDFVMVEMHEVAGYELSELTKRLCNRKLGIGADGAIFVKTNPLEFVYYNSDGSYSSFCGNGMRCFAKYCVVNQLVDKNEFDVICDRWKVKCCVQQEKVTVQIPEVEFENEEKENEIILVCGSRHKVVEIDCLENTEEVQSDKYNLNYVKVIDSTNISIKTVERGAGLTLACGSGSYASALKISKIKGNSEKIQVKNPGGIIEIDVEQKTLAGPANIVFVCEYNIPSKTEKKAHTKKGGEKKNKKAKKR